MRTPERQKKINEIEFLSGCGPTEIKAVFFYQLAFLDELTAW